MRKATAGNGSTGPRRVGRSEAGGAAADPESLTAAVRRLRRLLAEAIARGVYSDRLRRSRGG